MSTTLIELSVPWKELKKSKWEKTGSFIISKIVDAGFFFQMWEFYVPKGNIKVSADFSEKEF